MSLLISRSRSLFPSRSLLCLDSYAYDSLCVCFVPVNLFCGCVLFYSFYLSVLFSVPFPSFLPHTTLKTLSGLKPHNIYMYIVCMCVCTIIAPPPTRVRYHTIVCVCVWYLSIETPKKYRLTLYIELNTLNDDKQREIRKQTRHRESECELAEEEEDSNGNGKEKEPSAKELMLIRAWSLIVSLSLYLSRSLSFSRSVYMNECVSALCGCFCYLGIMNLLNYAQQ